MRRLTLKSIEKRIEALQMQAEKVKVREKKPALNEIFRLMQDHGISVDELRAPKKRGRPKGSTNGVRKGPRIGSKVRPMYRNPKTGETWSGRGNPARWITAAEKAGHPRTEYLIKK